MMMLLRALPFAAGIVCASIAASAQYYQPFNYQQQAAPRYNPFNGTWQLTYPQNVLNYNAFNGSWQYTQPGAVPQFNPFANQWQFPE
jgi:hypothetical protein